ncbi:MAG: 30S ribosomal protein S5 [Candidatus Pacebacteria bacterium]|nr:30S ribosomal protein S5 [Candidatus Paceibacterota bacterium]MDD5357470.1 30S ribosomal protein S5 [Candidatus Paceibacterota bacterium]
MSDENTQPNTAPVAPTAPQAPVAGAPMSGAPMPRGGARPQGGQRTFEKNPRRNTRKPGGRDGGRTKPEFDQKIISIRRVTRVASGGRRFSFSVALVAGNRKGSVGVGIGKGADTSLAIDKAVRNAKKHMIKLALTKTMSIPHEVDAKFNASRVVLKPARGRGVSAGSSVRNVIELAGITDISAKILSRSKNHLNNAQVAIMALSEFRDKTKKVLAAPTLQKEQR